MQYFVQESFQSGRTMIYINAALSIPENELSFTASRSGGPGGQNVNKVSSRVTLAFDLSASSSLSEQQKTRIRSKLAARINREGVMRVVSQRTRSQEMNREDAIVRFAGLLREALRTSPPRVKTKAPAAAAERRMDEKRKRTQIKRERSRKEWD
jgi:ribosome-associated protein